MARMKSISNFRSFALPGYYLFGFYFWQDVLLKSAREELVSYRPGDGKIWMR